MQFIDFFFVDLISASCVNEYFIFNMPAGIWIKRGYTLKIWVLFFSSPFWIDLKRIGNIADANQLHLQTFRLKLNCSISMATSIIISVNLSSRSCQLQFYFSKNEWYICLRLPRIKTIPFCHWDILSNFILLFLLDLKKIKSPTYNDRKNRCIYTFYSTVLYEMCLDKYRKARNWEYCNTERCR